MDLGFGQPSDSVIQYAYVVADLDTSMLSYSTLLGVTEWEVLRDFSGTDAHYRGVPSNSRAHLALGFSGHTQIELVQPADDLPSVHREVIDKRGYGFHHFGRATSDFDADVAAYVKSGYDIVFSDQVAPGFRVAYFDTRDALPGMTELMESGPALDAMFTPIYRRNRT